MSDLKGYRDQELLIRALMAYAKTKVEKSEAIIIGMIRNSINETNQSHSILLKNLKLVPQEQRDEYYFAAIDLFLNKMDVDRSLKKTMKYDSLKIYERWKISKREDLEAVDPVKASSIQPTDNKTETPDSEINSLQNDDDIDYMNF